MRKNLFPTILISVLLAFWGAVLFGYNSSEAIVINKSNSNNNLRNGLVSWYTFDGPDVTPNTTTDRGAQGNHGTRTGGVRSVLGKMGQAMFFDGSDDDDVINYPTPVVNTTTISFWYKTKTLGLPGNHRMFLSGSASGAGQTYKSLIGDGFATPFVSLRIGSTQRTLDSGVYSKVGKWTHVVVTWDGAFIRIYVDGIYRNISADFSGEPLVGFDGVASYIGRYNSVGGFQTYGSIDDVRFYNRALSGAEIVQLYGLGGGKINKTDVVRAQLRNGLIGHWTFDGMDVTTNTTTDRSGQGANGRRSATGTSVVAGKIGQAMKFNSSMGSSSINIASNNVYSTGATGTFSYSFWIKPDSLLYGTFISRRHWCANDGHFRIRMDSAGAVYLDFYTDLDVLSLSYASGNIISPGKWQYITLTKQWGTANATKLYLNGVAKTFTPTGDDAARGTTYSDLEEVIGAETDGGLCQESPGPKKNNFFNGVMDDVRIYNRILAPAEVVELYKMGGGVVAKTNTVQPNLKAGLLAHWTFDGKTITSNTSTDSSGNRNDGFLLASLRPLFAIGKIGQGAKFDTASRIIKVVTSSSLGVLGDTATISFWIKSDNLTGAGAEDIFSYGNGAQYSNGFMFYKTGRTFNVYWKAGGPIANLDNFFSTSTWYHIVMTNDNGTMNVYRNSIFYAGPGTTGGAITDATFNYYIGGDDSAGWFTKGILDDLRVYNRVISLAEIKQLYSMGK